MNEKQTDVTEKTKDFESSLARLEQIVQEMESGSPGLEEMLERFEEGQKLLTFCSKKLNDVERRIEILVKKGDQLVAEPFEQLEDQPDPKIENTSTSSPPSELF